MTPAPLLTLKAERERAGMTGADVAAKIGKTQSVYSKIERGVVSLSARDAGTLCALFRLTLPELLQSNPNT